jgi:dTMP kinase
MKVNNNMNKNILGKMIVVSGPDATGKTTQSKLLVNFLKKQNKRTLYLKVPTKFSFISFKIIYWMLKNGSAVKFPYVFHTIQFINKFLFQLFVLPVLLMMYDFIVFDRWALSAFVYGNLTGINKKLNKILFKVMKKPDITYVLVRDTIQDSREHDSYDDDEMLQVNVRRAYIDWALRANPYEVALIDANDTIENVHDNIVTCFNNFSLIKFR